MRLCAHPPRAPRVPRRPRRQLSHTDFAALIADPHYVFAAPYDDQIAAQSIYVVYPAPLQRYTEGEAHTTATPFFGSAIGRLLRNVCFTPTVYTVIDWINAHACWFSLLVLPVIIIACLTGDLLTAACCFVAGFIICWSLGFR